MAAISVTLEGVAARHPAAARGTHAIEHVDLVVGDREHVALIGPSGAGKTTLLSVCGLQLRPVAGRIAIDGIDPWTLSTRARQGLRRTLFVAPQVPPLPARQRVVTSVLAGRLPQLTALQAFASLLRPLRADLAHEALATMGLADKLWLRVDRLSGGERQRVALARLLVSDARRWMVDEPLSALDPALAVASLRVLIDRAGARGASLIASLHQVDLAVACFPRLVGMARGRIVFDRPTAEVDGAMRVALYGLCPADPDPKTTSSDARATSRAA